MTDDSARQGVEHLQSAAVEVIAAMRAFLDVAEDIVRDPRSATTLVTALAGAARPPAAPRPDGPPPRVTRIPVS